MSIKVHLVAERKLLEDFSKLVELVEESDSPSSIKVIWFDEPYVCSMIHFISKGVFPTNGLFIFSLSLMLVVLEYILINLSQLLLDWLLSSLCLYFLYTVVVLTKPIDLIQEILGREVKHELSRQVLKYVDLVVFAVFLHVQK